SVAGQLVGGGSSGVGGAVEEVGEELKAVVAVAGAELVHRGVHPRVEPEQLGVAVAQCADDDGAAVAGSRSQATPPPWSRSRMPVMVAGVQPGASRQGAGVEGTVAVDELEAVQVGVVEVDVGADVVVEQRQLVAELAQGLLDGAG